MWLCGLGGRRPSAAFAVPRPQKDSESESESESVSGVGNEGILSDNSDHEPSEHNNSPGGGRRPDRHH